MKKNGLIFLLFVYMISCEEVDDLNVEASLIKLSGTWKVEEYTSPDGFGEMNWGLMVLTIEMKEDSTGYMYCVNKPSKLVADIVWPDTSSCSLKHVGRIGNDMPSLYRNDSIHVAYHLDDSILFLNFNNFLPKEFVPYDSINGDGIVLPIDGFWEFMFRRK